MTAKTGTPMSMPEIPKRPPPVRMANSVQSAGRPVESPRIFGVRMLPSNCWSTKIITTNHSESIGLTISRISAEGTAPKNGSSTANATKITRTARFVSRLVQPRSTKRIPFLS